MRVGPGRRIAWRTGAEPIPMAGVPSWRLMGLAASRAGKDCQRSIARQPSRCDGFVPPCERSLCDSEMSAFAARFDGVLGGFAAMGGRLIRRCVQRRGLFGAQLGDLHGADRDLLNLTGAHHLAGIGQQPGFDARDVHLLAIIGGGDAGIVDVAQYSDEEPLGEGVAVVDVDGVEAGLRAQPAMDGTMPS